ncbi:MAG: 5'/3'-nucleotidase SurE [Clostridia bacterium]
MKILLTNDDGYFADGLLSLAAALSEDNEVVVCAPKNQKSGAGHSLSFHQTLAFERIDTEMLTQNRSFHLSVPCFAVDGTPSDCVKFAVEHLCKDTKFDVCISGINDVLNVGSDTIYSGTFGSAEEGTILGIKSIAFSTVSGKGNFDFHIQFLKDNLQKLLSSIAPNVTININVPSMKKEEINGVAVVPLGIRRYNDWYEKNSESRFQLTGYPIDCSDSDTVNDCKMSDCGYITITPVNVIATSTNQLKNLELLEFEL